MPSFVTSTAASATTPWSAESTSNKTGEQNMANTTEYRICPDSGLQFHKPAETLMKANAVAAVVFLLIGGILALLVTLTRWPAIPLLPADSFYQALTAHGPAMP